MNQIIKTGKMYQFVALAKLVGKSKDRSTIESFRVDVLANYLSYLNVCVSCPRTQIFF